MSVTDCHFQLMTRRFSRCMRNIGTVTAMLLTLATGLANASPTRPEEGKEISGICATCHGDRGIAVDTRYPNLAGQNYQYLLHALEQFKDGERRNDIMHSMTIGLSQTQIEDLATYFSNIRPAPCKKK